MIDFILKYWMQALMGVMLAGTGIMFVSFIALFRGMKALLRDRIIQLHVHYTGKGYCPVYGLENAHSMYRAYSALRGNGTVTRLIEELEQLPRKESI